MNSPDATLLQSSTEAAQAAVGKQRVRARLEREQAVLEELAQIGADIVRAIGRRAKAVDAEPVAPEADEAEIERRAALDDCGLTYTRVLRAIRLTFLLQAKLDQALDRLAWSEEYDEQQARQAASQKPKRRIELVIKRSEVAGDEGEGEAEGLGRLAEACERLNEDDHFGALLAGPASEAIDYIYGQFGLTPDWSALAETDWAREEIASGKLGAPLKAVIHPPPTGPNGEPLVEGVDFVRYVIPPLPPEKPRRQSG